jgi:hypothetical protein
MFSVFTLSLLRRRGRSRGEVEVEGVEVEV